MSALLVRSNEARAGSPTPVSLRICLRSVVAFGLPAAGPFDLLLDNRRRLAQALVAELVILHTRYLDVDVNAVEQQAGGAFLVFGDRAGGAGACFHFSGAIGCGSPSP